MDTETFLVNAASRQAHWIENYKNGVVKDLLTKLAVTESSILESLGRDGLKSLKKVQAMQSDALVLLVADLDELIEELEKELRDFGVIDAEFEARTIAKSISEVVAVGTPTESQIWAVANARPFASKLLKEYFEEFTEAAQIALKNQITTAFYEGYTLDELVESLEGTEGMGFRDGVFHRTRTSLRMMARTSISHLSSTARDKVYTDNSDVVDRVRWLSTLDGRTSAICRFLDGETFPINSGQRPPAHPNCRSTTIPVVRSEYELFGKESRRASKGAEGGKQVSGDLTYNEWLKTQPAWFQDDVLGEKKGKLFRSGKLTMASFVDNGKELNLEELKARFPAAWESAKIEASN